MKGFDYGNYNDLLGECHKRFGNILDIPITKDPQTLIVKRYKNGNVLDLGAGKEQFLKKMLSERMAGQGRYYSMDSDPCGKFDFSSMEDIPKELRFSLVIANQFFEHLDVNDTKEVLSRAIGHLQTGGVVAITVPNISHPNRQTSHIDHKTAWGYNSLYALATQCGVDVMRIYRYSKRHPQGIIEKTIAYYVSRIYRMDWCDSILLVAQKKNG